MRGQGRRAKQQKQSTCTRGRLVYVFEMRECLGQLTDQTHTHTHTVTANTESL